MLFRSADNLAAYTPVFATANDGRIAVTLAVFAVGVAVWCAAGALLTRHRRITDTLARYGRWILPAAFILIALYTLHATNAPTHLLPGGAKVRRGGSPRPRRGPRRARSPAAGRRW